MQVVSGVEMNSLTLYLMGIIASFYMLQVYFDLYNQLITFLWIKISRFDADWFNKMLHEIKPFSCRLCMSFWVTLVVYLLIVLFIPTFIDYTFAIHTLRMVSMAGAVFIFDVIKTRLETIII